MVCAGGICSKQFAIQELLTAKERESTPAHALAHCSWNSVHWGQGQ